MLNQLVCVGRITKMEKKDDNCLLTIAIPRPYKNKDGIYETDFITCELKNEIAKNTLEYCKKGDIVGIKGRLESEKEDSTKMIIVCEKLTFLSTKKEDSEE